jgi:hypothetical protein
VLTQEGASKAQALSVELTSPMHSGQLPVGGGGGSGGDCAASVPSTAAAAAPIAGIMAAGSTVAASKWRLRRG